MLSNSLIDLNMLPRNVAAEIERLIEGRGCHHIEWMKSEEARLLRLFDEGSDSEILREFTKNDMAKGADIEWMPITLANRYATVADFQEFDFPLAAKAHPRRPVVMRSAKDVIRYNHKGFGGVDKWHQSVLVRYIRSSKVTLLDKREAAAFITTIGSRLGLSSWDSWPNELVDIRLTDNTVLFNGRARTFSPSELENIHRLMDIIRKTDRLDERLEMVRKTSRLKAA